MRKNCDRLKYNKNNYEIKKMKLRKKWIIYIIRI